MFIVYLLLKFIIKLSLWRFFIMTSIFSLNLKNYRLKNKLTLQEFSEKLQISRTALSGYEKGLNEPNLYALLKIASVLDCSID